MLSYVGLEKHILSENTKQFIKKKPAEIFHFTELEKYEAIQIELT